MNKEKAHLFLPFVQAMADGKTIQWKSDEGFWSDIDEIEFCMYDDPSCYRIKPEPRTWDVWLHMAGKVIQTNPDKWYGPNEWKQIKVQEVLE